MSNLVVANVQKCLDILKRFHKAVEVGSVDEELKTMAKEALNHLENLFHPDPGEFQHDPKCSDCGVSIQSIPQ